MSADLTSYAGSVTIMDGDGNVAFEQELSVDEIIERLIAAIPSGEPMPERDTAEDEEEDFSPAPTPKVPRVASEKAPVGCEDCGSKGRRHKNGCVRIGKAAVADAIAPATSTSDEKGEMLTEEQYELVADAAENDFHFSPAQCAEELEVDEREVNRAVLMGSWAKYEVSYNRGL